MAVAEKCRDLTGNQALNVWISEMVEMCRPDQVVLIDGSEAQKQELTDQAVGSGEVTQLNQDKLPGCLYHRTAQNDVARVEHLTFICTGREEDAGPNNNWMAPDEAYQKAAEVFEGSMQGQTMYVIPFCMGPIGSPISKVGVELTDSIYVVLNMLIMARCGQPVLDVLGSDGEFTRGLHAREQLDENRRYIMHFPEDNAIWSVGSGYGGNVLLGKKCLALRIASYLAQKEGWLAEHMLILGIEDPSGRVEYVTAAFPSACGKTNLAMLLPPEGLKVKGYKIWCVGDDIAWIRMDENGQLWAINPESGCFGVAPGTNMKSNPSAMKMVGSNTIFTNVVLNPDGTVWWEEGEGEPAAEGALDWKGNPWKKGMTDGDGKAIKGAHANSRYTTLLSQCPCASDKLDDPQGVPISAIIFGGRRARLAPLVYESFDWKHGTFVGATMASERTAAQAGKVGEVRRDPMAMLPFCGYNMADYFGHWLSMGEKMGAKTPKIFHVNWFQQDDNGKFRWPGFGENLRVLEWILSRCRGDVEAKETPIGYVPNPGDVDLTGLEMSQEEFADLFQIDRAGWRDELEGIKPFFDKFGDRLPDELWEQHSALAGRLEAKKS
jgi:phosphoenolpyruvate carboxykinase (GTP)